jgi:Tfp pilus assembly protein PilX
VARKKILWARAFSEERGIALVMALGIMFVLAIGVAATLQYSTANQHASSYSNGSGKAFDLAEAGVNTANSVLWSSPDPSNPSTVTTGSQPLGGGTSSYSATLSGNNWTLTGTGTLPNPSGSGSITRTVSEQVLVSTNNSPWAYSVFSDSQGYCLTPSNNVDITLPIYVRGNLCLSNGDHVTGSPVDVEGTVTVANTARIGANGSPIADANLVGGCTGGSPNPHTCTSADKVYVTNMTQTPTSYRQPPIDLTGWYQKANPGPNNPCTTGSVPGGFDNDSSLNVSRATFTLMSGTAYDCRVLDASNNVIGRLSWTPGSPGTLVVAGTVFFDGNMNLGSGTGVYQGRGTIYVSGVITASNNLSLCATSACDSTWDPTTNHLLLAAGSLVSPGTSTATYGYDGNNNVNFQGTIYVASGYRAQNNTQTWGPVMASQITLTNNANVYKLPGTLPPGAPGIETTLHVVNGTWSG